MMSYVKSTGTCYLKILVEIVSMAISYPYIKIYSNIVENTTPNGIRRPLQRYRRPITSFWLYDAFSLARLDGSPN